MSTAASPTLVNVEEKLFQNRYKVDHGRPHIHIKDADVCANDCKGQQCTFVCPAACYKAEGNRTVTLITDGCLECGSCRVICTARFVSTNVHSASTTVNRHSAKCHVSVKCGHVEYRPSMIRLRIPSPTAMIG